MSDSLSPKMEFVSHNQVFKSHVATTGITTISKQMEFAHC